MKGKNGPFDFFMYLAVVSLCGYWIITDSTPAYIWTYFIAAMFGTAYKYKKLKEYKSKETLHLKTAVSFLFTAEGGVKGMLIMKLLGRESGIKC